MKNFSKTTLSIELILKRLKNGNIIINETVKNKTTPKTIGKTIESILINKDILLVCLHNRVGKMLILDNESALNDILTFIKGDVSMISDNKELNGLCFNDLKNKNINELMNFKIIVNYFSPCSDGAFVTRLTDTTYSVDELNNFAKSEL